MAAAIHPPAPNWLRVAFAPGLVKRSGITAVLVGSILNLINQGQAIFGSGDINWLTLCLTFMVPYCVSTFSGTLSYLSHYKALPETCASVNLIPHNSSQAELINELQQTTKMIFNNCQQLTLAANDQLQAERPDNNELAEMTVNFSESNVELSQQALDLIKRIE